ncbi:hypothetical protein AS156_26215 [Bradyrhizobium macuxiense]|uniref:Uncharacterized protein n=1 Tax=Bradyrhizobium macuxiense TaxID=1755647 RepID=A0A120FS09_9BRAD|nr:hypothetical protein AS156_26215 [Bradyrhizobium macuxiense]
MVDPEELIQYAAGHGFITRFQTRRLRFTSPRRGEVGLRSAMRSIVGAIQVRGFALPIDRYPLPDLLRKSTSPEGEVTSGPASAAPPDLMLRASAPAP